MENIDLHIHTNNSDGKFSPFEIIDIADKNKVKTIAISDHDSVNSYSNDVIKYAKMKQIRLIPAVEISTKTNKCGIHVLGYFNSFEFSKDFLDKLKSIRMARHTYLHNVSEKLTSIGYSVNVKQLDKITAVTKAHIARDIISNEKNFQILLKNFKHIPSMGEFIETIMNEGCIAYVKKETLNPFEASELIRSINGKVILAHPVAYQYEDNLSDEEILKIVKEMNADGIEANYIYTDKNNIIHDDSKKWNEFAIKNNLFTTIGSDFHDFDHNKAEIGFHNFDYKIEEKYKKNLINL